MSHQNHGRNMHRNFNPTPTWTSLCSICGKAVEPSQAFHATKTKRGIIWVHDACFLNEQRDLKAEKEAEA